MGGVAAALYWGPEYEPNLLPIKLTDLMPADTHAAAAQKPAAPSPGANDPGVQGLGASDAGSAGSKTAPAIVAPTGQSVQAGIAAPAADAKPSRSGTSARAAGGNATTPPVASGNTTTPAAAASSPRIDDAAEQSLASSQATFTSRLASLEKRGAGVWGGREFSDAKMLSAEAAGAHDAGDIGSHKYV